jgi:hypothetical protein
MASHSHRYHRRCHELYQGTLDVCMVNEVCKYYCMSRQWLVYMLPLRHNREYFVQYQNILSVNPTDGLKYGEHQMEHIWRWVCWSQVYGHDSCKTYYIEKSKKPALT